MKYKALHQFYHDQLGRVEQGQELSPTPEQLAVLNRFGWVEPVGTYETKVVEETPKKPVRRGK